MDIWVQVLMALKVELWLDQSSWRETGSCPRLPQHEEPQSCPWFYTCDQMYPIRNRPGPRCALGLPRPRLHEVSGWWTDQVTLVNTYLAVHQLCKLLSFLFLFRLKDFDLFSTSWFLLRGLYLQGWGYFEALSPHKSVSPCLCCRCPWH